MKISSFLVLISSVWVFCGSSYSFLVVLKGDVMLRNYRTQQRRKGKKWKQNLQAKQGCNLKTKLCWFHFNHPQGCIMQASDCNFAHSEAELEYLKGNGNEA